MIRHGDVLWNVGDKWAGGLTRFWAGIGRHTPGAKAPFLARGERPKAEALGYLDATATTTTTAEADPCGMTNKNCNSNCNCNCNDNGRSLRDPTLGYGCRHQPEMGVAALVLWASFTAIPWISKWVSRRSLGAPMNARAG
ncbi:hypothetical protein EDE15_1497 [Edaphobacter aggregans]|uniref:Uncharacterized protein n=1 Tax=Edaphobacter aggregans TaxID=570835 RepID=A0A3R9Q9Q2_9BACT|nr:hypothetical protein EDE15_1497 [Edaphobacter aggregans]